MPDRWPGGSKYASGALDRADRGPDPVEGRSKRKPSSGAVWYCFVMPTASVVRPFSDAYLREYSYHVRYEFEMFEWLVERFGSSLGLRLAAPPDADVPELEQRVDRSVGDPRADKEMARLTTDRIIRTPPQKM